MARSGFGTGWKIGGGGVNPAGTDQRIVPLPRSATWRGQAEGGWLPHWTGFIAGAGVFGLVSLVFAPNVGLFTLATFAGRVVTLKLVERRVAGLRDDPEGGQFAVNLRLGCEVIYGYDEGLLSFEEGWLVFHGRQCVFSLPANAVRVKSKDRNEVSFVFGDPKDERTAVLIAKSSRDFEEAIRGWQKTKAEPGAVILPPDLPSESVFRTLRAYPLIATLCALVLTALCSWIGRKHFPEFVIYEVAGLVALTIYAFEATRILKGMRAGNRPNRAFWSRPIRLSRWKPAPENPALPPNP